MLQKTRWILPISSMRLHRPVRGQEIGKFEGQKKGWHRLVSQVLHLILALVASWVSPYMAELAHRQHHDVNETGGWQLCLTPFPLSFQGCFLSCCPKAPSIRVACQSPVDPNPENLQRAFEEQLPAARPPCQEVRCLFSMMEKQEPMVSGRGAGEADIASRDTKCARNC